MNHADDVITVHLVESILQQEPGSFGRESFSLKLGRKRPADLEAWPSFGISESYPADEPGSCLTNRVQIAPGPRPVVQDQDDGVIGDAYRQDIPQLSRFPAPLSWIFFAQGGAGSARDNHWRTTSLSRKCPGAGNRTSSFC